MRAQDVQLYQYSFLPVIVLVITVSGILVAGMATAQEFERRTVKGLLLAPVPRGVIVAGKVAAGWVFTCIVAVLVLLAGALAGWSKAVRAGLGGGAGRDRPRGPCSHPAWASPSVPGATTGSPSPSARRSWP